VAQLHVENGGLQAIETGVSALFDVLVLPLLSVVPKDAQLLRQLAVAVGAEVLARVEAEARRIAQRAAGSALVERAVSLGPGDEVILPANTYIATALEVSSVGARAVLVDCDLATYNIDVERIEATLTSLRMGPRFVRTAER
jgi:hypothetical protein